METIRPAHIPTNTESTQIKSKIPEYARDFKNEWLFIRGINKEFKYFVDNMNGATTGLFESHKVDRIKYFIKIFLRGQERGKLQDISNFEINYNDVDNLINIKKNLIILINISIFVKIVMKMMNLLLILILVSKTFMMILNYFLVNLKLSIKNIFIIVIMIVIVIKYSLKSYNLNIRL